MQKICLDTGVISIFFADKCPDSKRVEDLFEGTLNNKYQINILSPVLSEAFYHICIQKGKISARTEILSLTKNYPINLIELNEDLIISAGELKCRYRNLLSYIDCFSISFRLIHQIPLHTTEKKIDTLPQDLQKRFPIVSYKWD